MNLASVSTLNDFSFPDPALFIFVMDYFLVGGDPSIKVEYLSELLLGVKASLSLSMLFLGVLTLVFPHMVLPFLLVYLYLTGEGVLRSDFFAFGASFFYIFAGSRPM